MGEYRMMDTFLLCYVSCLKYQPLLANLRTAPILMTNGDAMEQVMKWYHLKDEFTLHECIMDRVTERRILHLRSYYPRDNGRNDKDGVGDDGDRDGEGG